MADEQAEGLRALNEQDPKVGGLVGQLLLASANNTIASHHALEDSLREDNYRLRATLACIRDHVMELLAGAYMPTPHMISQELYPITEQLKPYIAAMKEKDNL
jgi:hypothetical protein